MNEKSHARAAKDHTGVLVIAGSSFLMVLASLKERSRYKTRYGSSQQKKKSRDPYSLRVSMVEADAPKEFRSAFD